MSTDPYDSWHLLAPAGTWQAYEQARKAAERRAAVRNLAGWPGVTADDFRGLCEAIGLDPREGR